MGLQPRTLVAVEGNAAALRHRLPADWELAPYAGDDLRFQRGLEVLSAVDGELGSKVVDSLADINPNINPDMAHHIVA